MANLYLTHKCTRGCPFCFARKVLKQSGGNLDETLSLDEIRLFLNRFKGGGGLDVIGLLGGEPFLYPDLAEAVRLIRKEGIGCKIFTSATNPLPDGLEDACKGDFRVQFVVNVGERNTYNDSQFRNLETFFMKFHNVAALSYTIFDLDMQPDFLFDLIEQYSLTRHIRTGIALPIYKGGNSYIPLKEYKKAGTYFIACAKRAAERNILMNMDCGFVACMFTDEQLGQLQRFGGHVMFDCGAAADIGPGLQAWNCFPLFQLGRINAMEACSMSELQAMLQKNVARQLQKSAGVFPQCETCELRERRLCRGGCKSFKSI